MHGMESVIYILRKVFGPCGKEVTEDEKTG
jgi:hypothetical protein